MHVGPEAGDSVTAIPDQYGSPVASVAALLILAAFVVALGVHFVYEVARLRVGGGPDGGSS